nr:hypothetical protein [Paenibacillus bovis]
MTEEIVVLDKHNLKNNPSQIGESIVELAQAIEDAKWDIEEIKKRGFWKRLTNNNTRDLAETFMKQNDTISGFLTIIQGIIFLSMNNVVVLGGIMDALNKQEDTNNLRDNQYFNLAKDYLSEALKSAEKVANNEKEIELVKEGLEESNQTQVLQQHWLVELNKQQKEQVTTIQEQASVLRSLKGEIETMKKDEQKQDKLISTIQTKLNTQEAAVKVHYESILNVQQILEQLESFGVGLEHKVDLLNDEIRIQRQEWQESVNVQSEKIDDLKVELESGSQKMIALDNQHASQKEKIEQQHQLLEQLSQRGKELESENRKLHKLIVGVGTGSVIAVVVTIIGLFI